MSFSSSYKIQYKFANICRVINGRAYKHKELLEAGKYRVLRVGNFFSSDKWYYSDLELDDDKYCENGDLLYAWSASFGPKIWDGEKVIYHYHIWKLEPSNHVNKEFLYYWLLYSREKMLSGVHGSVMGHLTKSSFEKQDISLPPLNEQRNIASILSALDNKIELNNRMNQVLEQMAQAIFKQWFVDFEFPNENGEPYKSSGGEMVDSELGMIPKDWSIKVLSEVSQIIDCLHSKKPDKLEKGKLLLQVWNIGQNGSLDLEKKYLISEEDYRKWTSRIEVQEGDCVITNVGRVGAIAHIPIGLKCAIGRNMTAIRSIECSSSYILENLLSDMRSLIRRLLKEYKYPPDEIPNATELVIRQAELQMKNNLYTTDYYRISHSIAADGKVTY